MWNVAAVRSVIEKLPTAAAFEPHRLFRGGVAFVAQPLSARSSLATAKHVARIEPKARSRASSTRYGELQDAGCERG